MKKGLSGNINVSGSLMTSKKRWKKAGVRQMLARRAIEPGFPIETPFETLEDVEKYLSGDRIVCLMCGKDYNALHAHLKVHGHTADSYKEKYRIPSSLGLIGREMFDKLSTAAKRSHELGLIPSCAQAVKEYFAAGNKRIRNEYKSVKEIENDAKKAARLKALREEAHKKRLSKTHCNKGHLLKEVGALHCSDCTQEWRKSRPNYCSNEEALNIRVDIVCTECGEIVSSVKKTSTRKVALCVGCKKRKAKEAKDKFRAENPNYRKEEYQKRKAKMEAAKARGEPVYIARYDPVKKHEAYLRRKAKLKEKMNE